MSYVRQSISLVLVAVAAGCLALILLSPEDRSWVPLLQQVIVGGLAGGVVEWLSFRAQSERGGPSATIQGSAAIGSTDRANQGLESSIGLNPSSSDRVAGGLQTQNPAQHLSEWLTSEANARRTAGFLLDRLPTLISALESDELSAYVTGIVGNNLSRDDFSAALRQTLTVATSSREWDALFERLLDAMLALAFDNADRIHRAVERENLWWMPRSSDRVITNSILAAIKDIVNELRAPDSDARVALAAKVEQFAADMMQPGDDADVESPEWSAAVSAWVEVWMSSIWALLRESALSLSSQESQADSATRGLTALIIRLGHAIASDVTLQSHLNQIYGDVVQIGLDRDSEKVSEASVAPPYESCEGKTAGKLQAVAAGVIGSGFFGALIGIAVGGGAFLLFHPQVATSILARYDLFRP